MRKLILIIFILCLCGNLYAEKIKVSGGGGAANAFKTISVSGQSDIVADSATDTLTLVEAGILAITTTAGSDTITFTATEVDGSTTNEINTIQGDDNTATSGLAISIDGAGIVTTDVIGDVLTITGTEAQSLSDVCTIGSTFATGVTLATTSGNVGIGTTGPGVPFVVNKDGVNISGDYYATSYIRNAANNKGLDIGYLNSEVAAVLASSAHMAFWTNNGSTWGERVRITSTGNVGIGTTEPGAKLHIDGGAAHTDVIVDADDGYDKGLWIKEGATNLFRVFYDDSEDEGVIATYPASSWRFQTNRSATPVDAMFIEATTGNVGIGTTGPVGLLHNAGTTVFTPSATTSIAAATGITVANTIMRIAGDGAPIDITADPQIVAGADGQIVIIQGDNDTNTVKLDDATGLQLQGGVSFTMGAGDIISFEYDSGGSVWIEKNRSNN